MIIDLTILEVAHDSSYVAQTVHHLRTDMTNLDFNARIFMYQLSEVL